MTRIGACAVVVLTASVAAATAACGESTSAGDGGGLDGAGTGICTEEALREALGAAAMGDTVRVGVCRLEGPFTVPAGVTLEGAGADRSVLFAVDSDAVVVTLEPAASTPTALRGVGIEVDAAPGGIEAAGAGAVLVRDVEVRVDRGGVAFGAEGLTELTIRSTELVGPLPPDDGSGFAPETAGHGLVLQCVRRSVVEGFVTRGFTVTGAAVNGGRTQWADSRATGHLAVGLITVDAQAELVDVQLDGMLQGDGPAFPYGGVFRGGLVQSRGLRVADNEGAGLLHEDSTGDHTDLSVEGNEVAGVSTVGAARLRVSGESSLLQDNGGLGIVAPAAAELDLRDLRIDDTRTRPRTTADFARVDVGDGIQVVAPPAGMRLEGLTLSGNERAGVVIDLDGGELPADAVIDDVTVDGTGEQLGFVVQNGTAPEGWDSGVTRLGATADNDAAVSEPLRGLPEPARPSPPSDPCPDM